MRLPDNGLLVVPRLRFPEPLDEWTCVEQQDLARALQVHPVHKHYLQRAYYALSKTTTLAPGAEKAQQVPMMCGSFVIEESEEFVQDSAIGGPLEHVPRADVLKCMDQLGYVAVHAFARRGLLNSNPARTLQDRVIEGIKEVEAMERWGRELPFGQVEGRMLIYHQDIRRNLGLFFTYTEIGEHRRIANVALYF